MRANHNCPFFGRSGDAFPLLIASAGNQCALLVGGKAPCIMQAMGQAADWKTCQIAAAHLQQDEPVRIPDNGPYPRFK